METKPNSSKGWRRIRRALVTAAVVVTVTALFYAEEDWRGKRVWEKCRREFAAKGEGLDPRSLVPPPVPDDQNYAMTPFLAPLLDLNPRRSEPGQSRWRDPAGRDRVFNFGQELLDPTSTNRSARRQPVDTRPDIAIWTDALGSDPTNSLYSSPAEAAADVLKFLQRYQPVFDELRAASRRPYSRFNVDYTEEDPFAVLLPHLGATRRVERVLVLQIRAEIVLGQNEPAYRDLQLLLFLSGSVSHESLLISKLVEAAILRDGLQQLASGLQKHLWTDSQLSELEPALAKLNLLADYQEAMRGERVLGAAGLEYFQRHRRQADELRNITIGQDQRPAERPNIPMLIIMPAGWYYLDQAQIVQMNNEVLCKPVDALNHRLNPAEFDAGVARLKEQLQHGFPYDKMLSRFILQIISPVAQKFAATQVAVDEARVACALERFHLSKGSYPDDLKALAPAFIVSLPRDVLTGEPFKYQRKNENEFALYSLGWNEKDDGGQVVTKADGTPDLDAADWAWPQITSW